MSHVGIYVGDGMMLHCGSPIQYANINSSYWQTHSLWAKEPADIPRLTEDVPNRSMRMKTLGNAVSPPQVFPILKYIADIETGLCPMGGEEL